MTDIAQNEQFDTAVAQYPAPDIMTSKVSSGKLLLLITVVNRQKGESFADMIQAYEVNMQMLVRGRGTASKRMLHLLGLEDSGKSVIFSVIKKEREKEILSALQNKFRSIKHGEGIAYTVPLSSMIGVLAYGFLSDNKMTIKESD